MANRDYADKDMLCASCGGGFVFSAGEQELYKLRGITSPPNTCPSCTRRRMPVSLRGARSDRKSA